MEDSECLTCVEKLGPFPPDEFERLGCLTSLKILDTAPDVQFDRVTSLASSIFSVPIALVSLLDKDRQWFKSNHGLGAVRETSRQISFCKHVIMPDAPDVTVVLDALADARFSANPLVLGWPHIRFYAGAPLRVLRDGVTRKIGTLCLIDTAREHGGGGARAHFGVKEKQVGCAASGRDWSRRRGDCWIAIHPPSRARLSVVH